MKNNLSFLCAFLVSISAYSQQVKINITGTLVDEETSKPIEYAAINIISSPDSAKLGGTVANEKGEFIARVGANKKFWLKAMFIGYKTTFLGPFESKNEDLQLGILKMKAIVFSSKEVVIAAEREDVQINVDKKVYSAEKNIASAGGNAVDLLNNIPSVAIDNDGNVTLRGSSQVMVFIDGKPSTASQNNAQAILSQIPASNIESVEVIANPGASFDAQGMAGIINIKLKNKVKKDETNGSITAGVGTRDKYNISGAINNNKGKLSTGLSYSFRHNPMYNKMTQYRLTSVSDTALNQSSDGISKKSSHSARFSSDYTYNKLNNTSFTLLYSYSEDPYPEDVNILFSVQNVPSYNIVRKNFSNSFIHNIESGLSHKKTFEKAGKEVNFGISYSKVANATRGQYAQDKRDANNVSLNTPFSQTINGDLNTETGIANVDYVTVNSKNFKIETGVKATLRNISNNFNLNVLPAFKGNSYFGGDFTYQDQVYAAYGQLNNSATKNKLQFVAGLRAEQTFINTLNYNDAYLNFFPNLNTSYKLKTGNDIQLTVARRINRPRAAQLNPFLDWNDFPYTVRMGNPALRPEKVLNTELAYILTKEKITFTVTGYYRLITNSVQYYRIIDSIGNTNLTFRNFNNLNNSGLEVMSKNNFKKWFDITTTLNVFQASLKGIDPSGRDISFKTFTWNIKSMANLRLPKGINFQAIGNYNGKNVAGQGTVLPMYGVDMALKKDFLKNKALTVNLTVSDVFNIREFRLTGKTPYFEQDLMRKRESRIGFITVTYKFGKADNKSAKKVERQAEDNSGGGF